jgi:predicted dehydrogenase
MTVSSVLRIGIVGCGRAARIHLDRLLALAEVSVVGCADTNLAHAQTLSARVGEVRGSGQVPCFKDHRQLLKQPELDALCIFTPHLWHYRLAMDALQAGCHLFIEKPLSTNVQEAVDIVGLARGRALKVAVGHQYRLRPSLAEARRLIQQGKVGRLRLITATLAQPWLAGREGPADAWRRDPKVAGGGMLADTGDHLIDALLWSTGQAAQDVYAAQTKLESGLDVVTAATLRLQDGTPATLAVTGLSPGFVFELNYLGERGRIRATDQLLEVDDNGKGPQPISLPEPKESIDGNFVGSLMHDHAPCCPADQALETVRLIEAVVRSGAIGQVVRLV